MKRKTLILILVVFGLAVAATCAATDLLPQRWFSKAPRPETAHTSAPLERN